LPPSPVRQRVLSVPRRLRYFFALLRCFGQTGALDYPLSPKQGDAP